MEKKIRVGIIGGGFGAKVHAPMMEFHPGFEVVSLASVARGRLKEMDLDAVRESNDKRGVIGLSN